MSWGDAIAEQDKFYLDVVSISIIHSLSTWIRNGIRRDYEQPLRYSEGLKMTLGWFTQGRQAWRTEPYLIPTAWAKRRYLGYLPLQYDNEVKRIVALALKINWQLLTPRNGDAAMDQLYEAMRPAINQYGNEPENVLNPRALSEWIQLIVLAEMRTIIRLLISNCHTFYWAIAPADIGEEKEIKFPSAQHW